MIRINLLPVRAARKKEAVQRHLLLFIAGLAAILLVGIVGYQSKKGDLDILQARNARLQREIDDLKKIIGEVDEYKVQQEQLEQKLKVIRELKAKKTGPVHMLDELALRIPEKLWLTYLEQVEKKISLEGVSINNEVIATFMSRLEESDYFEEVYLVAITAIEREDLHLKEFTVTAKLIPTGRSDLEGDVN
ncbi:MAG: hypothetical protein CL928_18545 [Deltaproteobacteria bacterium]|nr:hypothetical protein [Deltaproteobacteria bacterium]